jgi:hypothetical protein
MRPKHNKKLNFLNEKKKPSKKDDLSKYRKIYKIYQEKTNANTSDNRLTIQREKEKINKLKSLFGISKNTNILDQQQKKWEKLTKPKLPFSKRAILPKDERLKKLESLRPSTLYHNNHVINWIRNKYSSSVIEKSLYTILPEKNKNKQPEEEPEVKKRQRKMMEYLESLKEPSGREKFVKINPKYFYDEATFEKIKKLKDIFLEFDQSGNRKMGIDEITSLFNQNNIKANKEELVKLFFQNKKYKKKDYDKLYLNFYQFLKFALNKGHDFRSFMRKLKSKLEEEKKNNKDDKDKNIYLPMNLNLLLDYFILKSKEKTSQDKIENAIEQIDKVIKKIENSDKEAFSEENSLRNNKSENIKTPTKEKINNEESKLSNITQNHKDESIEKLDFRKLIDEFSNLFTLNKLETFENTSKIKSEKKGEYKTISNKFSSLDNTINSSKYNSVKKNFSPNKELYKKNIPIFYKYSKNPNDVMVNAVKYKMNQTAIVKMNFDNYKKYHNIKLALDATKEEIEKMQMSNILKSNVDYRLNKYFNKNKSLKSIPLKENRYKNSINNKNLKKSFIFKYKNISQNNSMKLFTKKELFKFNNKSSFYEESKKNISNNRRSNKSSHKFNESKSSTLLEKRKEQFDYYSDRKLDYVPMDLFSGK